MLRLFLLISFTILDINYVDFLQFQQDNAPLAKLKEAFVIVIYFGAAAELLRGRFRDQKFRVRSLTWETVLR